MVVLHHSFSWLKDNMWINSFEKFLEARLSDVVRIKSTSEFSDSLKKYTEQEFDPTKNLVKSITLKQRLNNKKIRLNIEWSHRSGHDIKERIKERTSFKSIEEFNDWIKPILEKAFFLIGKDILKTGKYTLYDSEYGLSIIVSFDFKKYLNTEYGFTINTILPGRLGDKIVKIVDI